MQIFSSFFKKSLLYCIQEKQNVVTKSFLKLNSLNFFTRHCPSHTWYMYATCCFGYKLLLSKIWGYKLKVRCGLITGTCSLVYTWHHSAFRVHTELFCVIHLATHAWIVEAFNKAYSRSSALPAALLLTAVCSSPQLLGSMIWIDSFFIVTPHAYLLTYRN